jgi:hypothetical protein
MLSDLWTSECKWGFGIKGREAGVLGLGGDLGEC